MTLAGTFCRVLNWFLVELYLETVNWEGPLLVVNQATWLLNILSSGLGITLIGAAAMMSSPQRTLCMRRLKPLSA